MEKKQKPLLDSWVTTPEVRALLKKLAVKNKTNKSAYLRALVLREAKAEGLIIADDPLDRGIIGEWHFDRE